MRSVEGGVGEIPGGARPDRIPASRGGVSAAMLTCLSFRKGSREGFPRRWREEHSPHGGQPLRESPEQQTPEPSILSTASKLGEAASQA